MRGLLWLFLILGFLLDVLALTWWFPASRGLADQPAIVIVPQLILAALFGGFGLLLSAISAAGLLIAEAANRRGS